MTNQEIFDKTVAHLRAQGEKAVLPNGQCCYRTEKDGKVLKCALGCHIPDDKYQFKFEGVALTVGSENDNGSLLFRSFRNFMYDLGFTRENLELLRELQTVHDGVPVERWEESFQSRAALFNLIYTPPESQ